MGTPMKANEGSAMARGHERVVANNRGGIRLVPDEERLDLSHYSEESVEF